MSCTEGEIVVLEPSGRLPGLVEALRRHTLPADAPLEMQRERFETLAGAMPVHEAVSRRPLDAGGVAAECLEPSGGAAAGWILYFHGGGYVIGSPTTIRALAANLVAATGRRVVTVDYRLAPEHPCPAAVDDAVAAWAWLLGRGVDPAAAVFAGDSAGGGLTVAAMVAARDRGLPLPAAGVCLSPWVDLTLSGRSLDDNAAGDPEVNRHKLTRMAQDYLGGADPRTPLASPVFADLTGLPPLLIQAGTAEALADDARLLAAAAGKAGVDATLELYRDMIHVWHAFAPGLPEATATLKRITAWLATRAPTDG